MIGQSKVAVTHVTRADPTSVADLAQYGVATIHEAMGRVGLLAAYMRPIYPGAKTCGTALTIFAHPGDNWMLHVAAELLQKGDVAVLGSRPTTPMACSAICSPPRSVRVAPSVW